MAVLHLDTARATYLNRDTSFPLASTFKIPIALQVLALVDEGRLRLDSLLVLGPWDAFPRTAGPIGEAIRVGSGLTIRNLLELMLMVSDNNATDILLRLAGSPRAVTDRLRQLGLDGIRVDRTTSVG